MNIHTKINYRSQFAHQFQKNSLLKDSIISLNKGFVGDFSRPHKDRRVDFKYHSYYPKKINYDK